MSNHLPSPHRGMLLSIVTGFIGLLLGGLLGIIIALVVFSFGLLLVVLLYFIGIFIPLDQISNAILFLQNSSDVVIYAIMICTAIAGAVIGYTAGKIPDWLRRT